MKSLRPELLSALIVLAFTAYLGYDLYLNYQQGVREIQQEFKDHQQTQEFRMKLAASYTEAAALRTHLAPEATSEWLLEHLNALARQAQIDIMSATPYPPRQFGQFVQPSVAIQLTTSYHQLGHLLSLVESSTPFIRIDDLDIQPSSQPGHAPQVRLTISTLYEKST